LSAPARTPIPRQFGFPTCFACGPDNARGLQLVFEREGDAVVCSYTAEAALGGYGTILHGGLTSTLLDEAMAWAVYGLLDKLPLTTELRVRFLGSVHTGAPLTVVGRIVSSDARGAQARAEIRNAAGELCAEGEGRLRFISAAAAARLSRAPA
jgi:acyl-coenzyme A thioesterase PaaI-like protein